MEVISPLQPWSLQEAESLLDQLGGVTAKGGAVASVSHLKSALYDWRVENQWDKPTSAAVHLDLLGFMFITFTTREPRHCTLRHFYVLEESRGQGVGGRMMGALRAQCLHHGVRFLRFFANKPAIPFYERCGFKWHGTSRTGLPFTYWDLRMGRLAPLPKAQRRYVVDRTLSSLTLDRRSP